MKRMFVCLLLVCASAAVAAVNREFRCETTVPVGDVRVWDVRVRPGSDPGQTPLVE